MGRFFAITAAVAAVAAVFAWNFYFKPRQAQPDPVPEPVELPEPPPEETPADSGALRPPDPSPPPVFFTEPEEQIPAVTLPELDASDEAAVAAMEESLGDNSLAGLLVPDSLIRKLVVTVDNLPARRVSMKVRALQPVPERLAVAGEGDSLHLDADNFARYAFLVERLQATEPERAADLYVTGYPLLQQAYEELGYPERQFHDRLVQVIDHLLETPSPEGPIRLTRPHVLYEFADPDLEALSAGQKAMIRLGDAQREQVSRWLVRFRDEIVARQGS